MSRNPSHWQCFPAPQESWDITWPGEIFYPSNKFWSAPGSPPIGCAQKTYKELREHPNQMPGPLLLGSSDARSSSSTPSFLWMSRLLTVSVRLNPATLQRKLGCLCSQFHSFGHYPTFMSVGEGLEGRLTSGSGHSSPRQSGATPNSCSKTLSKHWDS